MIQLEKRQIKRMIRNMRTLQEELILFLDTLHQAQRSSSDDFGWLFAIAALNSMIERLRILLSLAKNTHAEMEDRDES